MEQRRQPPYNLGSESITVDPVNGLIYFTRPTALVFGSSVTPVNNVLVFVPVATGNLSTYAPSPSTYSGTLYTVEGIERTKVITVRDWRDISNLSNMATYATEYLQSVNNVVVEGTVPYHGLLTTFLVCGTSGQGVSVTGNTYSTGWDSMNLPVVSVEILFQNGSSGTSYHTTLHVSNRRGRYSAENFLRPNVTGSALGTGTGGGIFGGAGPTYSGESPTGDASAWQTTAVPGSPGGLVGTASDWSLGGQETWGTSIESPTGDSSNWDTRLQP